MKSVNFTAMKDGTRAEYEFLREQEQAFNAMTAARIYRELQNQAEDSIAGYRVTRLEHGLQSASRAEREGADIDWIIATLLHDIGDGLAPQNHDRMAAEIIRPFVREEVTWVVEHHGVFQMVYYAHHYGWEQHQREQYAEHPYYQSCVDFCERWDQPSFDPDYSSFELEHFQPMIDEVFARSPYNQKTLEPGVTRGLPVLTA